MNSFASFLWVIGLVWAVWWIIGRLFGRSNRGGTNTGNNGLGQQPNSPNSTGAFLGGMGVGWLFGKGQQHDHHHHINNNDTIIDSNNDGIPDAAYEQDRGAVWDNDTNDYDNNGGVDSNQHDNSGGWDGDNSDSGGGWGSDSA
ncbi:MAG: hypothetical protein NT020_06970 [Chloroflexales bacterium]|nr:hypothetical protein [Chloroflexales bacterium]